MAKKRECESCSDLEARIARLEKRLDAAEDESWRWPKRWQRANEELQKAEGRISLLEAQLAKAKETIAKRDAQIAHLQKLLFGRSSEAAPTEEDEFEPEAKERLNRGKKPGTKGFGRKIRSELPVEIVEHDIPEMEKCCPKCGVERVESTFCEESEEITIDWKLVRLRHKRKKYKRACTCKDVPMFVTAAIPDKVIPKGLFATDFWAHILVEKYYLQRPLSRVRLALSMRGLNVSEGTLTGGLRRLTKLFAPIYNAIRRLVTAQGHWQMDETHWDVFVDSMGKENNKWWMWVTVTKVATLFILDPSRSSKIPERLLQEVPAGILSCDRYSAYKPLSDRLQLAFCWAHVRRDFIKVRDGYPKLAAQAQSWIERIDDLFHQNKTRMATNTPASQEKLEKMVAECKKKLKSQLANHRTHESLRSVLQSMENHWSGLTIFVALPEIPMDNNASERAIRPCALARKNYYGSRSVWSGWLSAMLFSIFSTLEKYQVDPSKWLSEYLKACAKNKGRPPADISPFLPWLMDEDSLRLVSIHRVR